MEWSEEDLLSALRDYEAALVAEGLRPAAVHTYVDQSHRFLRWRSGDYHPRGPRRPAPHPRPQSPAELADLEADLVAYERALRGAGLETITVHTYVDQSRRFVAWLAGTYTPGGRRAITSPAHEPGRIAPQARAAGVTGSNRAPEPPQGSQSRRGQELVRTPTAGALADARARYREIESRDLLYRAATDLVRRARDEPDSPLSLGEALAVLLFTWNSAFYRYHPAGVEHVDRIEALVLSTRPQLDRWRNCELGLDMVFGEHLAVGATFVAFETLLGPVGAAKALHLLAPGFFPIWDRKIAAAYHCALGTAGTNGERYIRFMSQTAEQCERLRRASRAPDDLVKALDEWNYVTFTRLTG